MQVKKGMVRLGLKLNLTAKELFKSSLLTLFKSLVFPRKLLPRSLMDSVHISFPTISRSGFVSWHNPDTSSKVTKLSNLSSA